MEFGINLDSRIGRNYSFEVINSKKPITFDSKSPKNGHLEKAFGKNSFETTSTDDLSDGCNLDSSPIMHSYHFLDCQSVESDVNLVDIHQSNNHTTNSRGDREEILGGRGTTPGHVSSLKKAKNKIIHDMMVRERDLSDGCNLDSSPITHSYHSLDCQSVESDVNLVDIHQNNSYATNSREDREEILGGRGTTPGHVSSLKKAKNKIIHDMMVRKRLDEKHTTRRHYSPIEDSSCSKFELAIEEDGAIVLNSTVEEGSYTNKRENREIHSTMKPQAGISYKREVNHYDRPIDDVRSTLEFTVPQNGDSGELASLAIIPSRTTASTADLSDWSSVESPTGQSCHSNAASLVYFKGQAEISSERDAIGTSKSDAKRATNRNPSTSKDNLLYKAPLLKKKDGTNILNQSTEEDSYTKKQNKTENDSIIKPRRNQGKVSKVLDTKKQSKTESDSTIKPRRNRGKISKVINHNPGRLSFLNNDHSESRGQTPLGKRTTKYIRPVRKENLLNLNSTLDGLDKVTKIDSIFLPEKTASLKQQKQVTATDRTSLKERPFDQYSGEATKIQEEDSEKHDLAFKTFKKAAKSNITSLKVEDQVELSVYPRKVQGNRSETFDAAFEHLNNVLNSANLSLANDSPHQVEKSDSIIGTALNEGRKLVQKDSIKQRRSLPKSELKHHKMIIMNEGQELNDEFKTSLEVASGEITRSIESTEQMNTSSCEPSDITSTRSDHYSDLSNRVRDYQKSRNTLGQLSEPVDYTEQVNTRRFLPSVTNADCADEPVGWDDYEGPKFSPTKTKANKGSEVSNVEGTRQTETAKNLCRHSQLDSMSDLLSGMKQDAAEAGMDLCLEMKQELKCLHSNRHHIMKGAVKILTGVSYRCTPSELEATTKEEISQPGGYDSNRRHLIKKQDADVGTVFTNYGSMLTEIISQTGKYYADGKHLLQNQNEETKTAFTTDSSIVPYCIRSEGSGDESILSEMLGVYPHDESTLSEAIEIEDFSNDSISIKITASSESNDSHKSAKQLSLPPSDKKYDEQPYDFDTSNVLVEWRPTLDGEQSVKKTKPKKGIKKKLNTVFRRLRKSNK